MEIVAFDPRIEPSTTELKLNPIDNSKPDVKNRNAQNPENGIIGPKIELR
jgi:hypothetical protein